MSREAQSYSTTVTPEDLEAARPLLHRLFICLHQDREVVVERVRGFGGWGKKRLLVATFVCAFLSMYYTLAAAREGDILLCVTMFIGTMVFFSSIAWQLVGVDRIVAYVHFRFTYPLIRWGVNRQIDRSIKLAPYSVVYRFSDTSYTASAPELKHELTIRGDQITFAYYVESVFCMFGKSKLNLKSTIFASADDDRKVVEVFLKRNHIDVREPKLDPLSPKHPVIEA